MTMATPSPLAPARFAELSDVSGIRLATAASGLKYKGRDDLLLIVADEGTSFAGVFTKSATAAAPVLVSRAGLASGQARAILTNAGNANAFTGRAGDRAISDYRSVFARQLSFNEDQILIASTGVIGEPLDGQAVAEYAGQMTADLGTASWQDAALAIRTTDTFAKGASRTTEIDSQTITVNGIAKGSGMIAPDMATMLAYIATDACIAPACLQQMLEAAVPTSFNAITVDSDTSTSDSLYLMATNKAGHETITDINSSAGQAFVTQLHALMVDLAQQIVRDGEGARKFITVEVTNAATDTDARTIAFAIANSPLVKTAIAGGDANWGRIVMAVGKSGARAERDRLQISIGGVMITQDGQRLPDYDETPVAAHMAGDDIILSVDIGLGQACAEVWTCDLTHGYIQINADYRS
ncbi:glutamate N-acetyltransferase/amino-acid acetyltransferase [SAR116 cluster alpha proteobacterium HIMB100]|nr:glutamate N-acetyltransferase/amino-acid acetyltransferase [SAR116 cluster alpha proteobacterium HIMB100]